jgi:GNAT superfamily N-acetyltransferase
VWQPREGRASSGEVEVTLSPIVEVVRTYLELRTPDQLRRVELHDPAARFIRRDDVSVSEYRRLYREVGRQWHWLDRTTWTDERLAAHLARPEVVVYECRVGADVAGFFELEQHGDGSVEISYFGLLQGFIGRGLGKAMLTAAATEAWALRANRVWLHTCTLDSPMALPNYKARGFTPVRTETYVVQIEPQLS